MSVLNQGNIVEWIFETKSINVCREDTPFWYASGTIGPYFINTHFLYGSEKKANLFLDLIEEKLRDRFNLAEDLFEKALENYRFNMIYKGVIDMMCEFLLEHIDIDRIDAISGGERRDWFFSILLSIFLKKPHITIFKDGEIIISKNGKTVERDSSNPLQNMNVLHIADLINKASSFEKLWISSIEKNGGKIKETFAVIDRKQGGREALEQYGSNLNTLFSIESDFFLDANKKGLIDSQQLKLVLEYLDDPNIWAKRFIEKNPRFLENSLKAGGKIQERASLWVNNN